MDGLLESYQNAKQTAASLVPTLPRLDFDVGCSDSLDTSIMSLHTIIYFAKSIEELKSLHFHYTNSTGHHLPHTSCFFVHMAGMFLPHRLSGNQGVGYLTFTVEYSGMMAAINKLACSIIGTSVPTTVCNHSDTLEPLIRAFIHSHAESVRHLPNNIGFVPPPLIHIGHT